MASGTADHMRSLDDLLSLLPNAETAKIPRYPLRAAPSYHFSRGYIRCFLNSIAPAHLPFKRGSFCLLGYNHIVITWIGNWQEEPIEILNQRFCSSISLLVIVEKLQK